MKHIVNVTTLSKSTFQDFYLEIFHQASFPSAGWAHSFFEYDLCVRQVPHY